MPFIITLASRIGAAIGMTWEYVLRNWKEDTYSSSRTGQLACEPTWNARKHDLCENILTSMWVTVMEDAKLMGDARLADVSWDEMRRLQWQGDGRKWVDPIKEAKAREIARKLGIETHYDQCGDLGYEAEDQIAKEMRLYEYCIAARMPEDVAKTRALGPQTAAPGADEKDEEDKDGDDESAKKVA